jgi:hypothetical protein
MVLIISFCFIGANVYKRIKLRDVLLLSRCLFMDYMLELNSLAFVISINFGSRHEFFVVKFIDFSNCEPNQYQPSQPLILLDCISLEIWLISIRHMSEYVLLPLCYISNGMISSYIVYKKMGFVCCTRFGGYRGWIDGRESFGNCSIGISNYSTRDSI